VSDLDDSGESDSSTDSDVKEARENLRRVREKEEKAKQAKETIEGDKDATSTVAEAVVIPGGVQNADMNVEVCVCHFTIFYLLMFL
jgi:regulator of protease activity HflC (stomatin/prohibitin superfamily)